MNVILLTNVLLTATPEGGMNWILKALLIAVGIGLVVGLIYASILKGELTSVYKNDTAADYTREGSFKVETSRDLFLYSKTEKEEKPQEEKKQ